MYKLSMRWLLGGLTLLTTGTLILSACDTQKPQVGLSAQGLGNTY